MKKYFIILIGIAFLPLVGMAQQQVDQTEYPSKAEQIKEQARPAYCDEPIPDEFNSKGVPGPVVEGGSPSAYSALRVFPTKPIICYKVQVAIFRQTDPFTHPMHQALHARWRPCEEVWVVESKRTFCDRRDAEEFKKEMRRIGYDGAYITQLVSYEAG